MRKEALRYFLAKFFGVGGFVFAIGLVKSHDPMLSLMVGAACGAVMASLFTAGTFIARRYGGKIGRKLTGLGATSGEPGNLQERSPPIAIGHEPRD
jgi:hypothetical protein